MSHASSHKIVRIGTDDARMSSLVLHGGTVYVRGLCDDSTDEVVGQTQAILATIDNLLAQAGTDKRTILTAQIWLKDMSDFAAMNTVWCAWVDPVNKPVRACVQSTLSDPAFLVEIQVTAAAAAMD